MLTIGLHKGYYAESEEHVLFKQIKSYVSGITYLRIKAYCKVNDLSQSELVRIAVCDYLNKEDFKEREDI